LVFQLLDRPYSTSQMTYDLRRLRLKGLVIRIQHTNSYTVSDDGIRFAVTYTKLGHRVLPRYSRPTTHPSPSSSVELSGSSTTTSRTTSSTHASSWLPETCLKCEDGRNQGSPEALEAGIDPKLVTERTRRAIPGRARHHPAGGGTRSVDEA